MAQKLSFWTANNRVFPRYVNMLNTEAYRILIADPDKLLTDLIKNNLEAKGFSVFHAQTLEELKKYAIDVKPHFIVADLMFPGMNGLQVVEWAHTVPELNRRTSVIVMGVHSNVSNVRQALRSGAVDYWVKPVDVEQVASRLVFQLSRRKISTDESGSELPRPEGSTFQFYLADLMLREAQKLKSCEEAVFTLTQMIAMNLKCVRVSLIACDEDASLGWVVGSSDDSSITGLQLNLQRYPEVNHVLMAEQMVVIENMDYDPRLQEIKKQAKSISFNAMIVCPVLRMGKQFGVLSCRLGLEHRAFNENQIRFARMASIALGFILERDSRNVASLFNKKKAA